MQALSDRTQDLSLDKGPLEQDLFVVVAQNRIAQQRENAIMRDIGSPLRSARVVRETIDLQHQALPNQTVDPMPFNLNLLLDSNPSGCKSRKRNRLNAGV